MQNGNNLSNGARAAQPHALRSGCCAKDKTAGFVGAPPRLFPKLTFRKPLSPVCKLAAADMFILQAITRNQLFLSERSEQFLAEKKEK
ncbi:MAG: hypothetical protein ACI4GY_08760 [Acutalibacteraceae bacterium]